MIFYFMLQACKRAIIIRVAELVGLLGTVTQELCRRPSAGLQLSHQGQVILYLQVLFLCLLCSFLTFFFSRRSMRNTKVLFCQSLRWKGGERVRPPNLSLSCFTQSLESSSEWLIFRMVKRLWRSFWWVRRATLLQRL